MSNTTPTIPRGVAAPSAVTTWLRAAALAAVAALAATLVTLAVVEPTPVDPPVARDAVAPRTAPIVRSDHDSGIERLLRDRSAGATAPQHDSAIELLRRGQ